ncbi:hypothetical protein FJZ40_04550 [Candidatus Shapirobacteria bacterium]|nr:hypothetical protein [Candidatus Shapirobacteria bacterium]
MNKDFLPKIITLGLLLAALSATYYFYQKGEIGFLPRKEKEKTQETFTVQLPISEKEIRLSYQDKLNSSFDIANFEEGENWYGEGEFDYSVFYEGESSLFVTSLDGKKATVSLKKNFDIKGVLNFKFLVHLATDPAGIEEFNLIFANDNVNYKFPIRDIDRGWNLLVLPKEKFSQEVRLGKTNGEEQADEDIGEVAIELISRPKARSTVNLDSLWAEKEGNYQKDWNVNGEKFLALKENKGKVSLLAVSPFGSLATLKKGSAKDGTFQAELTPLKNGSFGLFLRGDCQSGYGYYFLLNGADTNTWLISKYGLFGEKVQTRELAKGEIANFKTEKQKSYWLRAEMREKRLAFSFSTDGQSFTKLAEVDDDSFVSGGLGLSVSGGNLVLVDEVRFWQN